MQFISLQYALNSLSSLLFTTHYPISPPPRAIAVSPSLVKGPTIRSALIHIPTYHLYIYIYPCAPYERPAGIARAACTSLSSYYTLYSYESLYEPGRAPPISLSLTWRIESQGRGGGTPLLSLPAAAQSRLLRPGRPSSLGSLDESAEARGSRSRCASIYLLPCACVVSYIYILYSSI